MADHEDHNYYTRSNRESQIPDYDVNLSEPSDNILPSFAYRRQSQEFSPKRPTATTIFDQKSLEPRSTRVADNSISSHPDSAQDPHEFYRQYRESFQRRPESVYGQLDITAQTMAGRDSLTAVRQQRSPVSNRINGYNPSTVSARWNRSMENRKTPSPIGEKTASRQHNPMPRAKGDIQALVNKFNSVRDDPSTSTTKPTVRSSSATHLTASNNFPTPTSFKSRASVDSRSNISTLGTRPTRDSITGKLGGGSGGNTQASGRSRRPSQISTSTLGSQSMTNLSPVGTTISRQPLFGEILPDGVIMSDPGFGIPAGRRRGSEGSLQRSSTIFQDIDKPTLTVTAEPSSPSAWYKNGTPSLNGIDLDRPLPSKKTGMHRRSRSDFGLIPLNLVSHSASASKPVSILSPPQELPTPSPNSTNPSPSHSRLPLRSRRTSTTSDSGNSSGHHTPTKHVIGLPSSVRPLRSPEHGSGMRTPRRSTRYRNPSPPRQSSPKLDVHVADSSAPLKSPPLRSSRPRISVADASTAASRARRNNHHEETTNKRPPSKITNLPPNVNMEQRREMIRRDFTKSWHEKEEMQKRQSVYMQVLDELPIPDVPSPGKSNAQTASEPLHSSSENIDVFMTPAENNSPKLELTIPIQISSKPIIDHFANGDSPTLGTADFLPVARRPVEASEPASAVTEDTIDTIFEQHSDGSDSHHSRSEYGVVESSTTPRVALLSPRPEFDDAESIQIMLGESPALDSRFQSSVEQLRSAVQRVPTPRAQAEQGPPIDQYKIAVQVESIPASSANHADIPLASNVYATISANQDRESGGSIDALLETYQDSEPRRLFSQSPGLARAGGWDNAKVTRMYLQSRIRKTPELGDTIPPSGSQDAEDNDILQPAKMDILSAQILPPSRSPRIEQVAPRDAVPEVSPQPSLDVPNSAKDHRASLTHRNDFVDTSPSMLDWMHNHQPAEEPTIDTTRLRTNAKDNFLPDIPGGGLGIIDMKLEGAAELPSEMPADNNFISELHSSPQRRKNSSIDLSRINELDGSPTQRAETLALGTTPPPRKPVPINSSKSLQSIMDMKPLPEVSVLKIKKGLNTAINGSIQGKRPSMSSDSMTKVNGSPADQPQDEQSKRLRRRLNIIKELVDTESTYGQDMTVVVDIYKGTCNVVLNSAQDERALFINAPEIVAFSTVFLDALKGAAKSVYVLPKSKRWRSKRDSSATQESSTEDQSSLYGHDLSDEERDRLTNIGSAFLDHLPEMERCYTEFLKNSEAANAKLKVLQEDEKVKVWLDECCAYAKDLTTAWSLDSLLVKPLQRVTKYPLLLKELCDVTPENHPDFVKLDTAAREISGVSKRINDAKRRMEMVEKVSQAEKKKSKDESRLNLQKAFGRRSDRYKTQVGLQEQFQDREYNQISDKFGTHFFKLQIVMRDVEMYIVDVQNWVNKFNSITITMEDYFNIGSTTYPEIESKWRRFRSSMKDMHNTALVDHVNATRKFVVDPMTTLLKLHDGPQRLMDKRKKRVPDYVKYRLMKDRTEKVDKKTTESAELFLAVNDTLKDELPKLFEMTSRLVEACLNNFVQLQLQWQSVWKRKMIQAIELAEVPRSFADIVSDFSGDFRYTEAHVLSLGICNGSVISDGTSFLPPISQTSTLVGDSRRPSMTTIESSGRIRAASTATSASIDPVRNRGYSGPIGLLGPSPMLPSPDLGRPTEGFGLSSHLSVNSPRQPAQGLRVRASSTASNRSPVTPETANFQPTPQTRPPQSYGRPSTATGRGYESMPTHNVDMSRQRSDVDNHYQTPRDTSTQAIQPTPPSGGFRTSGIFNSAMPMSDSPLASSPVNDILASNDYNVLFLAASVYEFNIDRARREAGYPYLTYVAGEVSNFTISSLDHANNLKIFDVIAEKGELWLAKNQDDAKNQIGWIWNKHFAKLAS